MKSKILLSIIITIVTLVFLEIGLRQLVQPSQNSYGLIFNRELPPMNILPSDAILNWESQKDSSNEWVDSLTVKGKKITISDLSGVHREDELSGFAEKENSVSTNGWWKSNNFGARSSKPISPNKLPNRERVLFFGDSFTAGCAVPENETFNYYLNERKKNIEFINFGVVGYSMGQAFLRFKTLKDKLDFDRVFLVFVPFADLIRDITVNRFISMGWAGKSSYNLPRYVVENGKLKLIPAPYRSIKEFFSDNRDSIKARYRDHLRKYDYYYSSLYCTAPPLSSSD